MEGAIPEMAAGILESNRVFGDQRVTDFPLWMLPDLSSQFSLLLGEQAATDERWWRFLGRLHPLIVHFPIGLAIAAAAVELMNIIRRRRDASPFAFTATGFAAVAACLAAWFGWLNADFEGAAADNTLFLHRWLGILAAAGLVLVFFVGIVGRDGSRVKAFNGYRWGLIVCAVLVGVGSHFGGAMVYGNGYLTRVLFPPEARKLASTDGTTAVEPETKTDADGNEAAVPAEAVAKPGPEDEGVPVDDASVKTVSFTADVLPILEARCVECHGPDKVKGGLRLDSAAEIFAGDPEFWSVIAGQPEDSLLVQRVELPADDPDVMPPKGDLLTSDQIDILRNWIAAGAPHAGSVPGPASEEAGQDPPAPETEVSDAVTPAPVASPPSAALIQSAVASLRDRKVVVGPISQSDPYFEVNASLVKPPFSDEDLARLDGLQSVLIWANFARSGLTDAGIARLGDFDRITRLRLDNTELGDGAVDILLALPSLEWLNMYGTKLTDAGLARLAAHPGLTRLYCGDSDVTAAGVVAARQGREDLMIVGPEPEPEPDPDAGAEGD